MEIYTETKKEKKFTLQSVSTQAGEETVEGMLCRFECLMASGQKKKLNALLHGGLSKNDMELKCKVLSVPGWFADHWQLEKHNVTKPLQSDLITHKFARSWSKLKMLIGLDLLQFHPVCTAIFLGNNGTVRVSYCSFI